MATSNLPSSFPGIWKYPADRNIPFRNPIEWISGKRKDDNIGNHLWRVHDKLYNLESFIKFHPGGSDWLDITRGTDITEAFESSHFVNVELVEQTLSKFYIQEANEPRMSPYTFKENGFYKVLKKKIRPILKDIGTGPTRRIKILQDTLAILVVILSILATMKESIILQILAGFILTMNIIGAHNFLHMRDSWRKYYFDLGFLSSYEFRISHALSHHLYPNTVMDYEVLMLEPMFMFFPTNSKNWIQRYIPILYSNFFYCTAFLTDLIKRWNSILRGRQDLRKENLITFFELFVMIIITQNFKSGLISWLVINATSSYFFILCGINAGHHHPEAFHDGDEPRQDPDFGLCQLDALVERSSSIENYLITILTTFGEHSLHHLFPTVCHSKLENIKPIFFETLKEYSEEFHTLSQWELLIGTMKCLERTQPKKLNKDKKK